MPWPVCRFIACSMLIYVCFVAGQLGKVAGDGYPTDQAVNPTATKFVSPYSQAEVFEGLNISRTLAVGIFIYIMY